jgi:hypothetical protein
MTKQGENIVDIQSKLLEEKNKNFIIEEKYKIMEIEQKEMNKVIKD